MKKIILIIAIILHSLINQAQNTNDYIKIADSLLLTKDLDKASDFLIKAKNEFKNDSLWKKYLRCESKLVQIKLEQKEYEDCAEKIDSIINISIERLGEINTEKAYALLLKGKIYYENKLQHETGLNLLNKALLCQKQIYRNEKQADFAFTYQNIGKYYHTISNSDSALKYFAKSLEIDKEVFGNSTLQVSATYSLMANACFNKSDYEKTLEYNFKALKIRKKILGYNHILISHSFNNIGNAYKMLSNYDKALLYFNKSLEIRKTLKHNMYIAYSYFGIADIYYQKSNFSKALEYNLKSLKIIKTYYKNRSSLLSNSYYNIGNCYRGISELDKALEYYFKSLDIDKATLGEKHIYVAMAYNNIGIIYMDKKEANKALQYCLMSDKLQKEILGDKHASVIYNYNIIGTIYLLKSEYDLALNYFKNGLKLQTEISKKNTIEVADFYHSIAKAYSLKGNFDKSIEYYQKNINILRTISGEFNTSIALAYNEIGRVYENNKMINKALESYQKSLNSLGSNKNCESNIWEAANYSDLSSWKEIILSLQNKALIYENKKLKLKPEYVKNPYNYNRNELALNHYIKCDSIISNVRNKISTKSDKFALGQLANEIYSSAINICLEFADTTKDIQNIDNYLKQSFYFSEQNKSMVLQSSLAHSKALESSTLPDSLQKKERDLQLNISKFKQKIANEADSLLKIKLQAQIFDFNREYEELIKHFEIVYPDYYNIKHNNKNISVNEIQNKLKKKTALISYFTADSVIYISVLTKKALEFKTVNKPTNFNRQIQMFQKGILSRIDKVYNHFGHSLYNTLIPEELISSGIKNLIIIPDANLTTIPFEALLSDKVTQKGIPYGDLPYLAKKYTVSYAYSAKLWLLNQNKTQSNYTNDFLALAPVFANSKTAGTTLRTRSFFAQMDSTAFARDSISTRGRMLNGEYISALPATETEVTSIFELFKKKKKKATVKTHKMANEEFVKSDSLSNSRIVHIATHGFVNEEKPELSGIILAQDTLANHQGLKNLDGLNTAEDGILYSGEIYNLDLNAKLVVLSACETGLGQIKKGEGVIGLSRSLMYAGAENLIVSLWKVADESTSELLINFYREVLKSNNESFKKQLYKAKLKMINSEEYSHPFYWSPFILIGD